MAEYTIPASAGGDSAAISHSMLDQVLKKKLTLTHAASDRSPRSAVPTSLLDVHFAVASPVLNEHGEVIAVLYGDRWNRDQRPISDLEKVIVDMLAGAVSNGIARQREVERRNNLAGFFSPRVANLLSTDRRPLEGEDAEVSVLFCDIRGFSAVAERHGPKRTITWINDVLGQLSQCVVDRDGVLVDYVGDELMAMWGKPGDQEDHATRALDCGLAMLEAIEVLRDRHRQTVPAEEFGAGIGISTGEARVGNVGSIHKFKYGVLGNTVNLGSRLQSATKQLGIRCLVSEATIEADRRFPGAHRNRNLRHAARLKVVGIQKPLSVYEVTLESGPAWNDFVSKYESALNYFWEGDFAGAAEEFGRALRLRSSDRPSMLHLARVLEQMTEPSNDFQPVLSLQKK
jgi:class 3 adenylate cyclase